MAFDSSMLIPFLQQWLSQAAMQFSQVMAPAPSFLLHSWMQGAHLRLSGSCSCTVGCQQSSCCCRDGAGQSCVLLDSVCCSRQASRLFNGRMMELMLSDLLEPSWWTTWITPVAAAQHCCSGGAAITQCQTTINFGLVSQVFGTRTVKGPLHAVVFECSGSARQTCYETSRACHAS